MKFRGFFIVIILAAVALALLGFMKFKKTPAAVSAPLAAAATASSKTTDINRDFKFPINDNKGAEVTKLNYTIINAELRDDIVLQGQKATALPGRTFLIINLKLKNDSNTGIQINARDYVRLSVNNSADWLAADIHNDPVEVQPISSKYTRLGFPINKTDKDFHLQVGEIKGVKTAFPVEFN